MFYGAHRYHATHLTRSLAQILRLGARPAVLLRASQWSHGHTKDAELTRFDISNGRGDSCEDDLYLPAEQIRVEVAAIRNVNQVGPGHHVEQLPENMGRGAHAGGTHVDLARVGLSISDEFRNSFCRDCRIDRHDEGGKVNVGDRRNVTEEIEGEVVVNRRIERVRGSNQE